jgi:hypothetical protein
MAVYTLMRSLGEPLTKVFTPQPLSAAQDSYTYTDQRNGISTLELTGDVAWSFRSTSAGPSYPVAANIPFRFPVESTTTFYVVAGGSGTLCQVALG